MFAMNSIVSILCGALYGLGMSTLILSLNTRSIRSLRSYVVLTSYVTLLYACLCFLPLLVFASIAQVFVSMGRLTVFTLMLGIPLLMLAANIFIHVKICRTICPPSAVNLMRVNGILITCVALTVLGLRDRVGESFIIVMTCFAFFLCGVTLAALLLRDFSSSEANISHTAKGLIKKSGAKNHKVIWFGIDSATWDVMSEMISEGRLPNLSAVIKKGSHARLKSFVPTRSPVIWTSKATGKIPIKHGIRDFLVLNVKGIDEPVEVVGFDPVLAKIMAKAAKFGMVRRRPVGSRDRNCLAIWNILSGMGYRVGVAGWFATDPVEKIDGFIIPEFFYTLGSRGRGPASRIHPLSVEEELKRIKSDVQKRFNSAEGDEEMKRKFLIDGFLTPSARHKLSIFKTFYFLDVLRMEATDYLLSVFDLDMLMIYFRGVDVAQHHFWGCERKDDSSFRGVIPRYYEYIDEIFGKVMNRIPDPKTVFVTSDHGHGPAKRYRKLYSKIIGREVVSGCHSDGPDGIFIASGNGIRKGVQPENVSVYDIVPTILSAFGLPVGRDMDGRPIEEVLDEDILPIKYITSFEDQISGKPADSGELGEDREILDRLKDLGYID